MTQPLKLLLVTDAVGGVWIYSLELARALRAFGVETVLAVTGPSPGVEQRRPAAGLRVIDTGLPLDWMPTTPAGLRRAGEALADLAEREGADFLQTCSAALLASIDFPVPTVAVQHSCVASWWAAVREGPLPEEFGWRRDLVREGLRRAALVVAPSAAFAAVTARLYDLQRPVVAVHNGRAAPIAARSRDSDFVFTAGRLWDEGKNVGTLDAAAARLPLPFVAAGPMMGPDGTRAKLYNLELLGPLSETQLAAVNASQPIFTSAALYEPFGLSVLEAASAGCALVLSDIPTFRELWTDCALFVSPRDADGFAAAIQRLIDAPEEREQLARRARERSRGYTPEAMGRRMAELYRQLVPSHTRQQPQLAGAA